VEGGVGYWFVVFQVVNRVFGEAGMMKRINVKKAP
jgi:hypothetical protein